MKRKYVFDRFLSAIFILFSFVTFGFTDGTISISGNVEQTKYLEDSITIRHISNVPGYVDVIAVSVTAPGTVTINPNDPSFYNAGTGNFKYIISDSPSKPAYQDVNKGNKFESPISFTMTSAGTKYIYLLLNNRPLQDKVLKSGVAQITFIPSNPDPVGPTNNVCKTAEDKNIGFDGTTLIPSVSYSFDGITKYSNSKYTGFYGMLEAESAGTVTIETDGNCKASLDLSSPSATDCEARAIVSRTVNKNQKFYIRVSPNDSADNGVSKQCKVKVNFTPSDPIPVDPTPVDPTNNTCKAVADKNIGIDGDTFISPATYTLNGITKYNNNKYLGFYGMLEAKSAGTANVVTDGNCKASLALSSPSATNCEADTTLTQSVSKGQKFYLRVSPNDSADNGVSKNCEVQVNFAPSDSDKPKCKAFEPYSLGWIGNTKYDKIKYEANGVVRYSSGIYTGFWGAIDITSDGTVSVENCEGGPVNISIDTVARETTCMASSQKSQVVTAGDKVYVHISPSSEVASGSIKNPKCSVKFTPKDGTGPGGGSTYEPPIVIENPDAPKDDLSDIPDSKGFYKDFTGIDNYLTQKTERFYGGNGKYVYGDYAVAGNSVLTYVDKGNMADSDTSYKSLGGFTLNGSSDQILLPNGVTKDDIEYVRLFWQGHIFNTTSIAAGKNASKGYKNVELKINSNRLKEDKRLIVSADSGDKTGKCDGYVIGDPNLSKKSTKYRMQYACTQDITDLVKEQLKDGYISNLTFSVGNIKTSDGLDGFGVAALNGTTTTTFKVGPYGGWGIVVVYDKKFDKDEKFDERFKTDLTLGNVTGESAKSDKQADEYIQKYFKPKSVSIFGHNINILPYDGLNPMNVDGKIEGFYTPRYGDVQGKFSFLGFAADSPLAGGEYFKVQNIRNDSSGNTMSLLSNSVNTADNTKGVGKVFNSTKTTLEPGSYKEKILTNVPYGFDLDEFDISKFLGNQQTSLKFSLGGRIMCGYINNTSTATPVDTYQDCFNKGLTPFSNQNYISMLAISIDLYTPDLCYLDYVYDTDGWMKFFDEKGNRKVTDPASVEDIRDSKRPIVTGEQLFYKVKFENRMNSSGGGEDALGASVKIDFGPYNDYVSNSSTIDNTLTVNYIKDAKFVYLKDNDKGTYLTYQNLYDGTNKQDINRQYNTYKSGKLDFYIGKNAGLVGSDGMPTGGEFKIGQKTFVEFNATVGRTYQYQPLSYTATYRMKLTDSDETFPGPRTKMQRCEDPKPQMAIHVLNGLRITNQNYKDLKDKNKTTSQDDRLFTQIAELPFDVNMIFKPDAKDIFGKECLEHNSNGDCIRYDNKLCTDYSNAFVKRDEKCVLRTKQNPDGTYTDELIDGLEKLNGDLQFFELSGNLYLSAIRGNLKGACRYINDTNKIPFGVSKSKDKINNPKRYMTDYLLEFQKYQNKDGSPKRKVMPIENLYLEDAFDGVTFMISYFPKGLQTPDTNTSKIGENLDTTDETEMDYAEYFINETRESLLVKAFSRYGYKKELSDDEKKEKLDEIKNNHTEEYNLVMYGEDGVADGKDNGIEDQIIEIRKNVSKATSYFGVNMSADGSFHVCESDIFVVRPSYFDINLNNLDKYGKLVDTNIEGDITKAEATDIKHESDVRVGGDYTENTDILHGLLYAKSNEGNAVPNYYTVIGGDLSESRYAKRNGFGTDSLLSTTDSNSTLLEMIRSAAVREEKTYLKPFISNDCYSNISEQSYYLNRDPDKQGNILLKEHMCSRKSPKYCGITEASATGAYNIKWKDGELEIDDAKCKLGSSDIDKFGKSYYNDLSLTDCSTSFDKEYFRIWDKTGTSLWVDFGVYSVSDTLKADGYTPVNRYTPKQILQETLREPSKKSLKSAVLYTGTLIEEKITKGKIFNYYNVGDVMVKVYDNDWTDRYGNQTFNSNKNHNNEYWGATCIINSTRNTPVTEKDVENSKGILSNTDIGKIGCDVTVKDNKNLILRYQPDRVVVSIEGMKSTNGETDNAGNKFVYYNQPDTLGTDADGNINRGMLNDLNQQGMLSFHGRAFLSNKLYQNTIASLYDGTVIEGEYNDKVYDVARCGFANDMNVTLEFMFDCNKDDSDSRCMKIKKDDRKKTEDDVAYAPFINLPDINYTIPKDTEYLSEDQCRQQNGSDSRCFMFNPKTADVDKAGNVSNINENKDNTHHLPLNLAISYYTNINKTNGFVNNFNTKKGIIDPKHPFFTLLARSFKEGETQNATIFINFDRMQKKAHLPLYLFATDFNITKLSNTGKIEPAKFNTQGALLNVEDKELIMPKTDLDDKDEKVKFTNLPYKDEVDRYGNVDIARLQTLPENFSDYVKANIIKGTSVANFIRGRGVDPYILFVYGKANEYNDGEKIVSVPGTGGMVTYFSRSTKPINIAILDAIYCDRNDNCQGIPDIIINNGTSDENLAPSTTVFTNFADNDIRPNSKHFITNSLTKTLNATSVRNWVGSYNPETTGKIKLISEDGRNRTLGAERLQISAIDPNNDTGVIRVRVNTYPWLIYTPHVDTVLTETNVARYSIITPILYYNYFDVAFRNASGDWGGEGEVKDGKEGDVGSFISGKDFEDIAGSNKADEGSNYRQERIDW